MTSACTLHGWWLRLSLHQVLAPKPARSVERPPNSGGNEPPPEPERLEPIAQHAAGGTEPPAGSGRPGPADANEFFETNWPKMERLTYDIVQRLARGTSLSPDDVEDVVQEVRLAVLRLAREGYRALPCEFRVLVRKGVAEWLRGTAAHKVSDTYRRRSRAELPLSVLDQEEDTEREGSGLERLLGDGGLAARQMLEDAHRPKLQADLREALGELTPLQEEAVVLVVHRGASYQEAATHLRVPIGTVKSRVLEARRKLRRTLRARGWELDDE